MGSGKKQRTGIEVLSFLFSTLEYFAYKPHFGVKPKLFINGFNLLDVFSKSVALLSRSDIRQYQSDIPEDVFSSDERGANLHDMVLLRITAMYLDAFPPTIIEVAGNYYNYQMIPELKMDTEQVKFIEIIEDEMFESKLQYGNLFEDCSFETIHDIVGGNPSKIGTFYEKYFTPELMKHQLSLVENQSTKKQELDRIANQSLLNYLDGEKDHYERKLHMACLLAARYIALQKAEKKNLKTIQELSIDDYQVQFTIHDAIEKIMSLKGKAYHFNEEFDPFIQTIGGSILLNSELMYYQIHDNVLRPYDQCYYSYFAKTLEDLESSWSLIQYWYYRLVWQPLNGIKHVDRTLGKHGNIMERTDESRHTPIVQP